MEQLELAETVEALRGRGCRGSHRRPSAGVVLIRARTNRTGAVREA